MRKNSHHYNQINAIRFITFRTHASMDNFLFMLQDSNLDESHKQYSIDQYIDHSPNGCILNDEIIGLVKLFSRNLDPYFYHLYCVSVMPNHVHLLFKQQQDLGIIMKKLKGGLANLINKRLGLSGKLWQKSYFDKAIRDDQHFQTTYRYIKYNAIKAGLTDANHRFFGIYDKKVDCHPRVNFVDPTVD